MLARMVKGWIINFQFDKYVATKRGESIVSERYQDVVAEIMRRESDD